MSGNSLYLESGVSYPDNPTHTPPKGIDDYDLKSNRWNPTDYLNIWIVNKINGDNITNPAYTKFPNIDYENDGIVITSFCIIQLASYVNDSRIAAVLPHEMGHILNLYHVFQCGDLNNCPNSNADCPGGDEVNDTDPVTQWSGNPRTGQKNFCIKSGNDYKDYDDYTERNLMSYTTVSIETSSLLCPENS